VTTSRYLTLLWPGLPWLWLRGSVAGLVLAVAFAVVLDVSLVLSWVWTEIATREFVLGLWVATAGLWGVATLSAVTTFPPPLPTGRDEAAERLFVAARDAYLGRDWLTAETTLRSLLEAVPTDGEAQLLLATLLRRAGRLAEARTALERLARADVGRPWMTVIRREVRRIDAQSGVQGGVQGGTPSGSQSDGGPDADEAVIVPLPSASLRPEAEAPRGVRAA